MSTDLAIYDRIADPTAAVKQFGLSIAQSGIFNTTNNAQGEVLALECMTRRMPPLMLAERYHIIHNRLSMKSEAMLSVFNQRGGKHRVKCRTPERAEIELTFEGDTNCFAITWEECLQEPFVYEGKESVVVDALAAGKRPPLKSKYATPRARMQMMWARVVSDAIRVVMPSVNSGTYTPEEVDDFDEPATNGNGNGNGKSRSNGHAAKAAPVATSPVAPTSHAPTDPNADAIDVPFEVSFAPGQPVTTSADKPKTDPGIKLRISTLLRELDISNPGWDVEALTPDAAAKTLKQLEDERMRRLKDGPATTAAVQPAGDACSAEQSDRIKELWGLLNASPEQRDKMLSARNAKTARNLTAAQAADLIGKLEIKLASIQPTAAPAEPCGPEMAARIKARLAEVNQTAPGTVEKFRAMMARGGVPKIENLLVKDAQVLLDALQGNGMEAFFGMTVAQWPTPVDPDSVKLSNADTAVGAPSKN